MYCATLLLDRLRKSKSKRSRDSSERVKKHTNTPCFRASPIQVSLGNADFLLACGKANFSTDIKWSPIHIHEIHHSKRWQWRCWVFSKPWWLSTLQIRQIQYTTLHKTITSVGYSVCVNAVWCLYLEVVRKRSDNEQLRLLTPKWPK